MSELAVADGVLADLEPYRGELTGYCYRMLGSTFDADDAVQETFVKAWQSIDGFEGRSSLRSWLYRIATNVCLDALRSRKRRAVPMDMMEAQPASNPPGRQLSEDTWLEPVPNTAIDPAELTERADTVRLAFVAALQHLPPRQRAVLILREVLAWQAAEVAELLDTTVVSVNSALQRARATLSERDLTGGSSAVSDEDRALLARYVAAFEAYDINGLVSLLAEDASSSMPPYEMWLSGWENLRDWYLGYGIGCKGSRMIPVSANGMLSIAQYRVDPAGGHAPWAIHVLETSGGQISHIHHFLEQHSLEHDVPEPKLFARFGLPAHL